MTQRYFSFAVTNVLYTREVFQSLKIVMLCFLAYSILCEKFSVCIDHNQITS